MDTITNMARQTSPFKALRELTDVLNKLEIHYVVAGSLALSLYSYHRFANDIDLIVASDSLSMIRECLDQDRYKIIGPRGNRLTDTIHGVNIDFLLTGDCIGNRKSGEITYPDPRFYQELREGFKCLPLDTLIELKLASGQANLRRLIDLADVQELIVLHSLPREFAALLHPSVQSKYLELIDIIENNPA